MRNLLELKIIPNRTFSPTVYTAAASCINSLTGDDKFASSAADALALALNNVILHASSEREFDIILNIYLDDGKLHVELCDTGIPYDLSTTEEAGKIINITDSYKVENLGRNGRCQSMVYTLKGDIVCPEQENLDDEDSLTGVELRLRDAVEGDYIEVSRAYYREMGFSYMRDAAYKREAFAELINSELNHGLVAETLDGRFAGFHMLLGWTEIPGVYEGGMAITTPLIRKCGAFAKLMEANNAYFDQVIAHGVQISQATTVHEITQKTRLKYGYTPCGFLFNGFSSESYKTSFKEISSRQSYANSCHVIDHSHKDIYVPAEVTHVLDVIYEGEKLPRTYHTESLPIKNDKTILEHHPSIDSTINLIVSSVGKDYKDVINNIKHLIAYYHAEDCQLYMRIDDPGAVDCYEELKNMNFRFTGLLPNTDYGDMLMMSNPLNNAIDYDSIVTYGPFADMLEMIKKFDPDLKD